MLSGQARHRPIGRRVCGMDAGLPGVHFRLAGILTSGREVISFYLAADSGPVKSLEWFGWLVVGVRVLFENSIVCRCTNYFLC